MDRALLSETGLLEHMQGNRNQQDKALFQLWENKKVRGAIFKLANQLLLSQKDVEDVLQEALVKLVMNIQEGKFKGESKITTYLIGIARNLCHETYRKNKKLNTLGTDRLGIVASDKSQESIIIEQESKEEFEQVMQTVFQQLRIDCQQVLILSETGNSRAAIAKEMNYSNVQSAKNKVLKCRKALRAIVESSPKAMNIIKSYL